MLTKQLLRPSNKLLLLLTVFSSLFAFIALSSVVLAEVNLFEGNVSIGTNSSTNGARVGVYVGSDLRSEDVATVGEQGVADGKYVLDFQCNVGDSLFLKVCPLVVAILK